MTVKVSRRSVPLQLTSPPSRRPPLSAISDEAAALHCEHFRRGPGAVKSYMTDDLVVWDERSTVHLAPTDFQPARRRLIRVAAGSTVPSR